MSAKDRKCIKCKFALVTSEERSTGVCLDCQELYRHGYGTDAERERWEAESERLEIEERNAHE